MLTVIIFILHFYRKMPILEKADNVLCKGADFEVKLLIPLFSSSER